MPAVAAFGASDETARARVNRVWWPIRRPVAPPINKTKGSGAPICERSLLNSVHSEKTSDNNYDDDYTDDIKDIH